MSCEHTAELSGPTSLLPRSGVLMTLLIVMALCWPQTPRAYAQGGIYISSSVDTTGRVSAWSVTNVQDMQHQAHARITLQSPNGRNVSAYRQDNIALGWARADTSLAYDANDLGVYTFRSVHDAYCVFMGWFISNVALNPPGTTVPYVLLSLRTSGSISSDNAASSEFNRRLGTTSLGTRYYSPQAYWGTGVEIAGEVFPSSFAGSITIHREVREEKLYAGSILIQQSAPPIYLDTSDNELRDDNPQPGGRVYDLDAPGIGGASVGTINRFRVNFRQWAVLNSLGGLRVSPIDLYWYSRVSIIGTTSGDQLRNDIPGDNVAGAGQTETTWNLQ